MAIADYDALRLPNKDPDAESLEELKARRAAARAAAVDVDEVEAAEDFELPGADLSGEELTVSVVPMLADEFRCDGCFLVRHRSQLACQSPDQKLCRDCA